MQVANLVENTPTISHKFSDDVKRTNGGVSYNRGAPHLRAGTTGPQQPDSPDAISITTSTSSLADVTNLVTINYTLGKDPKSGYDLLPDLTS